VGKLLRLIRILRFEIKISLEEILFEDVRWMEIPISGMRVISCDGLWY
jgi:hypothetical protein